MSTEETLSLAASLRHLAALVEANPFLEDALSLDLRYLWAHQKDPALLDRFAEAFNVEVRRAVYHVVTETQVGCIGVLLQCRTEEYEKATGKTVDNTAVTA